jgi:hypothetical protein
MERPAEAPRPYLWTREKYVQMRDLGWFTGQQVELIGGQIVVHPGPDLSGPPVLPARRWSPGEFYRMVDLGLFLEQRVELMDGEVIEMPAQKNLHAIAIALTEDALRAAFGAGHWVRVQMTLDLGPRSVVDPDLAVIAGTPRSQVGMGNPTTALLVVEVSETSLPYDRTVVPRDYRRTFERAIDWLTPTNADRDACWLSHLRGWSGGKSYCRLGRVMMEAMDMEQPPRILSPIPVLAQFEEAKGPEDRILVGLHAGILQSRRLIVMPDLREAWLEDA